MAKGKTERMRQRLKTVLKTGLRAFGAQMWIDPAHVEVRHYRPQLPGWPQDFPLRLVMLSDFHIGEPWLGVRALEQLVERTNALKPDIVLLLGDYDDGPRFSRPVDPAIWGNVFKGLQAPLGVHAVLGNHDYPAEGKRRLAQWRPAAQAALEAAGVMVHVNRALRLPWRDKAFWLAGLGDQVAELADGRRLANIEATLAQIADAAPVLLLAHEPDIFPQVPSRVALTLSGHLHRGQIQFFGYAPVLPSLFGQRFLHGHIVEEARHLIVGSGLGHSGLPLRFQAPPEIVLIELGSSHA